MHTKKWICEAKTRNTPAHEIGHTLIGAGHWWKGIMKSGDDRSNLNPADFDVTIGNVTKILRNAQFGSSASVPIGDSFKEQGRRDPKVTVHSTGNKSDDFVRGSVKAEPNSK
jgi:hypothetical protein